MNKEIYVFRHGKLVKATKWIILYRTIKSYLTRFKIVDTWKYQLIPHSDSKYIFKMSPKEYEDSEKLYKENGTISYEFYPCGGIGWGIRIHLLDKDNGVIDITDYNSF